MFWGEVDKDSITRVISKVVWRDLNSSNCQITTDSFINWSWAWFCWRALLGGDFENRSATPQLHQIYSHKSFDTHIISPITCKYRRLSTYPILNDFKGLFCNLLPIITTRSILKLTMINPLNFRLEGSNYKLAVSLRLNYNIFDFERIWSNFLENLSTWVHLVFEVEHVLSGGLS